ncbi:MAG: hypothetical protein QXF44_02475 [Candidatus Bathyarchaeia archaeon]
MNRYKYVNLPADLYELVEKYVVKSKRYTSIASFVQEAVRLRLEELGVKEAATE